MRAINVPVHNTLILVDVFRCVVRSLSTCTVRHGRTPVQ